MKRCEQCGDQYWPREVKQRFCTRSCSDAWFAAERREGVARLRQERAAEASTYFAHALGDASVGPNATPVHVTGAEPSVLLPAPPWSDDMASLPDEPPLGFCIDDLPPEARS